MTNAWIWIKHGLIGLALGVMLFHLFIYLAYTAALLGFPFDYDQGEGFELLDAVYFSEGRWPYQDSDEWPFYSSNYAPVFRLILAPFAAVFGPDYWYGRLLSFLGTCLTAAAIGWAVYRAERHTAISILIGLAFLASNYIYHIGPLFRQHYFMVMFETLAVVAITSAFEAQSRERHKRLVLGLFLLLLAGYTKQLAAFTAVAIFGWLFLRNPRTAILYGLGFGLVGGGIFLLLNIATAGQWKLNAIDANVNPYYFSQFTGLLSQYVRLHWALLGLAGLLAVYELYFDRISLYSAWWVVGTVSTVGAGKWGAGDSYFATSWAATCILAGIFIARTLNQSWMIRQNFWSRQLAPVGRVLQKPIPTQMMQLACLGLLIVYGLTVVKIPTSGPIFEPLSKFLGVSPHPGHRYPLYDAAGWTAGYATIGHLPTEADTAAGWEIVARIQAAEGPVMSEEAGFSLQAGKEVISNPTQLKNLDNAGLLDHRQLVAAIEDQTFGLIIFRARFYPEPVLAAVDDAYTPREIITMNGFNYEMWYPEPTWDIRRDIRNHLESGIAEPLTVALPTGIDDQETWLIEMMGRWAWLPEIPSAGIRPPAACLEKAFIRREARAVVEICNNTLTVQPSKR